MRELDWGEVTTLENGLRISAVEARHFSGRSLSDRNRTLWCGFVVHAAGGNILFLGDTAFGPHFAAMARAYSPFRLALIPIGAYLPRWFMAPVHMSPEEAAEAHRVLQPAASIAIHHDTFALADEAQGQATRELWAATGASTLPGRFLAPQFGVPVDVPALPR